ncbi:hypothetical protein IV203_015586 [Nitzschia inconspicua]|uniref:Uncharacterized protein n=1 Tax=Nitzschia inconspicua TaxID=303405 RepID=A0A9K3LBJ1_9STRA|nr:hypothetical protein IV203_015586 [Nitzschia inconspicua]
MTMNKSTFLTAVVTSFLLFETLALEASVNGGCPKGFYCAHKKQGGAWCNGHNECLSGECIVGVGCAMTSNNKSGSDCNFDSDCDVGFKCGNSVCYVPDVPQEHDAEVVESTSIASDGGLSVGAVVGIALAAVVAVVLVASLIAMRASSSKIIVDGEGGVEEQVKKDNDEDATETGSDVGVDQEP